MTDGEGEQKAVNNLKERKSNVTNKNNLKPPNNEHIHKQKGSHITHVCSTWHLWGWSNGSTVAAVGELVQKSFGYSLKLEVQSDKLYCVREEVNVIYDSLLSSTPGTDKDTIDNASSVLPCQKKSVCETFVYRLARQKVGERAINLNSSLLPLALLCNFSVMDYGLKMQIIHQ